jgi:hypothetical protein
MFQPQFDLVPLEDLTEAPNCSLCFTVMKSACYVAGSASFLIVALKQFSVGAFRYLVKRLSGTYWHLNYHVLPLQAHHETECT